MRREIGYLQIRAQTPPTGAQNSGPGRASRNAIQGSASHATRPRSSLRLLTREVPIIRAISKVGMPAAIENDANVCRSA
jgi:hypothetical protein